MHERAHGTNGVHRFSKNNYFYGKLLTVDDMADEQAYHAGVQRTLSRFVTDWGGLCGLDVSASVVTDETGGESLVVTVSEGLALDRCGRLIVVGDDQRETLALPVTAGGETTDTVGVYVEYDECFTDPVPAAKMESACEEECEDNRIVEDARVTVEPGDPGEYHKSVAEIDFPDPADLGLVDGPGEQSLAVRGDLAVGSEEGTLDLTVATTAPSDTVVVDLGTPDDDTLAGSIRIPPDSLVGPGGFTLPEGEFRVTGDLDVDDPPLSVEGTVTATPRPADDEVAFAGTLGVEDDTDRAEFEVDVTVDFGGGDLSIEGRVSVPGAEWTANGDLVVGEREDEYLLDGVVQVRARETGPSPSVTAWTIETVDWDDDGDEVPGVLVDRPAVADPPPEAVDVDAVLAGLARSYYRNEPRTACGDVDEGAILIGTITAGTDDWRSTSFERGPLVYTNDMLFDVLARHVGDFENPHHVSLAAEALGEISVPGGADAFLSSGGTFEQEQVLFFDGSAVVESVTGEAFGDTAADERTFELREVGDDDTSFVTEFRLDDDGHASIDTGDLDGEYVLRYREEFVRAGRTGVGRVAGGPSPIETAAFAVATEVPPGEASEPPGAGARVRIRGDDPGNAVDLGSSDDTVSVGTTPGGGETPSEIDLTVSPEEIAERIDAIATLNSVPPDDDGDVDLVAGGAVTITPSPDDNEITLDVPEVEAIETLQGVAPDGAGNVALEGTGGITVTTGGNRITIDGPDVPDVPEMPDVPDLDPLIEATVRRSGTCKFVSYSAAAEEFGDASVANLLDRVATDARGFVESGDFTAGDYVPFVRGVIDAERTLNDRLTDQLDGAADREFTTPSIERYLVAFDALSGVDVDVDNVPEIAAAQDCLARAVEALRRVQDQ